MQNNYLLVICAFSRPLALDRLLKSLCGNQILSENFDIVLSIDYHKNGKCHEIAKSYKDKLNNFEIIAHKTNLGLKKNILFSANLVRAYKFVILLEEDVWCHPEAFEFAINAYKKISDDKIAQIALYSYEMCQTSERKFQPLKNKSDFFFSQIACSSGQLWTHKQWRNFKNWLEKTDVLAFEKKNRTLIPANVFHWSNQSWKKLFFYYLLDQQKYVAYPFQSYTTNVSDEGGTNELKSHMHQVSITSLTKQKLTYEIFDRTNYYYDMFSEINFNYPEDNALFRLNDIEFNLKGAKGKEYIKQSSKTLVATPYDKRYKRYITRFSSAIFPFELNMVFDIQDTHGDFILINSEDFFPSGSSSIAILMREKFNMLPTKLAFLMAILHKIYSFLKNILRGK